MCVCDFPGEVATLSCRGQEEVNSETIPMVSVELKSDSEFRYIIKEFHVPVSNVESPG